MELVLLKIGCPEWEEMWQWLAIHPFNEGYEDPTLCLNEGEGWEYMGSFKQGDRVISQIRHRCHPRTQDVKTLSYAHPSVDINSIEVNKKL